MFAKRRLAEKLDKLTELLAEERARREEAEGRLLEVLEKAGKRGVRMEALCEDILETLQEPEPPANAERSGVSYALFFGIMEYFDLLSGYCVLSRDEALAAQAPLVMEKASELLKAHGAERIDQTGVPVDLSIHSVEGTVQPPPGTPDRTVARILVPGYRAAGIIQKARVTAFVRASAL